jgi:ABC-type spermidine/putrescine transport system permease subunit I
MARAPIGRLFLLAPAVLAVLIVLVVPAGRLLLLSVQDDGFTLRHYHALVTDERMVRSFGTSLWLSLATTLVTIALGYPLAYLLAVPLRRVAGLLMICVLVPFWTSATVRSFAFLILLGRRGPINRALVEAGLIGAPLPLLFTPVSVLIGLAHIGLPLMVFPLYATMRQIDPSLTAAALSLGAGPIRAFREVIVPLSLPGLAAGATLVFITTMGAYVIPALLGGKNQNMVGQFIVTAVNIFRDLPLAATITVALLGVIVAVLIVTNRAVGLERVWDSRGRLG